VNNFHHCWREEAQRGEIISRREYLYVDGLMNLKNLVFKKPTPSTNESNKPTDPLKTTDIKGNNRSKTNSSSIT
jgi:hypothetical protein